MNYFHYFKNKLITDSLECLDLIFPKTNTEKKILQMKRVKLRLKDTRNDINSKLLRIIPLKKYFSNYRFNKIRSSRLIEYSQVSH